MRPCDEGTLAVFLAAAVLVVTGSGIAAGRLSGADEGVETIAAAVLAAPDRIVDPPVVMAAPGGGVTATRPDRSDDPPALPADDPGGREAGDAPDDRDDGGATATAGVGEPVDEPEPPVEPTPVAVPVLAGRGADSLLPSLDLDAVDATAARTGIPARALSAYVGASLRMEEERPGCGLTWVTLAAVGWVESHHGTIDGRTLRADGVADRPIIGVPLDGGPGVRAIPDTDGGRWDGDDRWDRAVGPMQFIPSTWQRWQVDASGTGMADPQHIDDAALAAARYLCASGGGDLGDAQTWYRAVFAYNRSDAYVRSVLDAANHYAARANAG